MKVLFSFQLLILLCILPGCNNKSDTAQVLQEINNNLRSGNLLRARFIADSLRKSSYENMSLFYKADSLSQIAERINIDFSVTKNQVIDQIKKRIDHFSSADMEEWEEKGWLEYRLIEGNKMYFKRAASNLLLIKKFYENRENIAVENSVDPALIFRLKHTEEVLSTSEQKNYPVIPVHMEITYTITVKPDVVPEGEKIRCWLPWPRENHARQGNIIMLGTSSPEYTISPDTAIHSTIYMEGVAKKGIPSTFMVSFLYSSSAQYFNIRSAKISPYDTRTTEYKEYTSEQLPHIRFTNDIKYLADSITSPADNPSEIVRNIYYWFKENIPWTGALEYSIIPDIPGYVYLNRRGDCGMQTFMFISMLRYKGVPVRWQSGWMVPPDSENLHDWCEVYYEGTGWVPVDISYDLQQSEKASVKEYFISGIDSYRLIINDGIAGPLYPEKQYFRSEPYDFQRGEVEWKGGNLYFDKWDYDIQIKYLN